MTDKLMNRYDALGSMTEYPQDYAEKWSRLALDFAIDARYSMAAKCREKAAHYSQVKINGTPAPIVGKMTIQKSKQKVIYLEVA